MSASRDRSWARPRASLARPSSARTAARGIPRLSSLPSRDLDLRSRRFASPIFSRNFCWSHHLLSRKVLSQSYTSGSRSDRGESFNAVEGELAVAHESMIVSASDRMFSTCFSRNASWGPPKEGSMTRPVATRSSRRSVSTAKFFNASWLRRRLCASQATCGSGVASAGEEVREFTLNTLPVLIQGIEGVV